MALDTYKNFSYTTVATAPSPASSGTSLVVAAGTGTVFPVVPFNAVVWPAQQQPTNANAEIVRVTARATDTLTIVRTQEATSARSIVVGDQIAAAFTAKLATDLATAAFSAYKSADQTGIVTAVDTKVTFNTEEFDTQGWFDAVTNSRFTPLVAGIYRLNVVIAWGPTALADAVRVITYVYKNGSPSRILNIERMSASEDDHRLCGTCLVNANGSSDFFEVFVNHSAGANRDLRSGTLDTRFEGELVKTL